MLPYHLINPWLQAIAFAGLFASLVYFLMYIHRRYALALAGLFLLVGLFSARSQLVTGLVPGGIAWLSAWLVPNNPYGLAVNVVLLAALWGYFVWRWRQDSAAAAGSRRRRHR